MRVLLTGGFGFLGWHTRVRLEQVAGHDVIPVGREDWPRLSELMADVNAVVHLAGFNRGPAGLVEEGNVQLSRELAAALRWARAEPRVVFANSIQCGNETPYGVGKARASDLLAQAAQAHGLTYVDVRLPNLFGEHGRPHYNSFVATFVAALLDRETPQVVDRPINLLHVQQAAQCLLEALAPNTPSLIAPRGTQTTVQHVFERLAAFHRLYAAGEIPSLETAFDVDLFNTLRSALFPRHYPIRLIARSDQRGSLVEVVRAHGCQGQTFVSSSHPGVTRGEHFHVRKIERFVVLSGEAQINLRRLYTNEVASFAVDGRQPSVVDMPTLWTHNIVNTGPSELTTLFWTNELFDPDLPDTYPHPVNNLAPVGLPS